MSALGDFTGKENRTDPFAEAVAEIVVNRLRENRLPRWFMLKMQPNFNFAYNIVMQAGEYARIECTVSADGESMLIDFIRSDGASVGRFRFWAADDGE